MRKEPIMPGLADIPDIFYGDLAENTNNTHWFIVWVKRQKENSGRTIAVPLSKYRTLLPQIETLRKDHNVFFSPCLQKYKPEGSERGKASGVSVVPGFKADIDIQGHGHAETKLPTSLDEALDLINSLPWQPTLTVFSGGGIHAHWLFREPFTIESEDERRLIQVLARQFQAYVKSKGDEKKWELDNASSIAGLVRLPETVNHKGAPIAVKVIQFDNSKRYNPDDFESFLPTMSLPDEREFNVKDATKYDLADIDPISDNCPFIQHCIDDASSLKEPEWTVLFSILGQCENGRKLAHEYSRPHSGYDFTQTEKKFDHVLKNIGPRKCQSILEEFGDSYCVSCQHNGKITSPVQLGAKQLTTHISENIDPKWVIVRNLFPRIDFPWFVFNPAIEKSLKQLARSCATSNIPLPGVVFAVMASLIGRKLSISPKDSWKEPLLFWVADIQESGEGKTPATSMLIKPLYKFQREACDNCNRKLTIYNDNKKLPKADQTPTELPIERGFVSSDYTIEGLVDQLNNHPHGGFYCDVSELSAIISGQNQYKQGGSDRESLLKLWDGKDIRSVRKGGTTYIRGPRVSIAGGIQPQVFKQVFGGKKDIYLQDGTVFRFLFTFDQITSNEFTAESWDNQNQKDWHELLDRARSWAENQPNSTPMILSEDAQSKFFQWCNELEQSKSSLPVEFKGFLPKAYSYCLRLTGIIHCLNQFHNNEMPSSVLHLKDLEKGIAAIEFYLGQAVDAMMTLTGTKIVAEPDSDNAKRGILRQALTSIQKQFHKDKILISAVMDAYNSLSPDELKFENARAFGPFLRNIPLNVPVKSQRVMDKTGVCLESDEMLRCFLSKPD